MSKAEATVEQSRTDGPLVEPPQPTTAPELELAVTPAPPEPMPLAPQPTPAQMIQSAIEKGQSASDMEALYALYERMEDRRAEQEFNRAFAAFQQSCPTIKRTVTAEIVSKSGSRFKYDYAPLDEIDRVVIPALKEHGLSRSFGDSPVSEKGLLSVTCILSHIGGHSREATVVIPVATSAGMSEQQKYTSAETTGKRRAFVNVAGLKVGDVDHDGNDPAPPERIDEDQALRIEATIREIREAGGKIDSKKFLEYFEVEAIADIPATGYSDAMTMLRDKMERASA